MYAEELYIYLVYLKFLCPWELYLFSKVGLSGSSQWKSPNECWEMKCMLTRSFWKLKTSHTDRYADILS